MPSPATMRVEVEALRQAPCAAGGIDVELILARACVALVQQRAHDAARRGRRPAPERAFAGGGEAELGPVAERIGRDARRRGGPVDGPSHTPAVGADTVITVVSGTARAVRGGEDHVVDARLAGFAAATRTCAARVAGIGGERGAGRKAARDQRDDRLASRDRCAVATSVSEPVSTTWAVAGASTTGGRSLLVTVIAVVSAPVSAFAAPNQTGYAPAWVKSGVQLKVPVVSPGSAVSVF